MMENLIELSVAREPDRQAISLVRLFVGVSFVVVVVCLLRVCLFVISLVVKGRAWLSLWGIAKLSRCGKLIVKNMGYVLSLQLTVKSLDKYVPSSRQLSWELSHILVPTVSRQSLHPREQHILPPALRVGVVLKELSRWD